MEWTAEDIATLKKAVGFGDSNRRLRRTSRAKHHLSVTGRDAEPARGDGRDIFHRRRNALSIGLDEEGPVNFLERMIAWLSPTWGESRARARLKARHFEAASAGRRTSGWNRLTSDANAAASGAALSNLRAQSRDLVRNNPWARRGLRRIVTNTVGWGIRPKATGRNAELVMQRWKRRGETTQCDAAGRLTFFGLQRLAMRTVVESGEVLIRRRRRRPEDGLAIPLQLQVLEPDYIDTSKDGPLGDHEPLAQTSSLTGVAFSAALPSFV